MYALCLKQPYASWVADGSKTIETRTWRTHFRGRFLVVASLGVDLLRKQGFVKGAADFWARYVGSNKIEGGFFPRGFAIATANLDSCRRMRKEDEARARCNFYRGAFAWGLTEVEKIPEFQVKGRLGFFEVKMP